MTSDLPSRERSYEKIAPLWNDVSCCGSPPSIGWIQGLYYLATGIWPIISMRSFEAVTGPKKDDWLVKTVGMLIGVIGVSLIASARRRRPVQDQVLLGAGSAAGLAAVDTVYALERRISPSYLLDAVVEMVLVAGWLLRLARAFGTSGIRHA